MFLFDHYVMLKLCNRFIKFICITDEFSTDTYADEMTETFKAITIQPMYSALNDSRAQKQKDINMDILYGRVKIHINTASQ